ncbi:Cro/C1-type HTH domain protein [Acididesulfobacillus acetoxydans]|uniref:Cro/C1-type HTH domain protein n=1 Tax=Acididesulfobacillus acetoxydans TaxID=1561005 RepID=A0A8S0XB33_9FIRM|nr:Cro/C1-type HTH domain protein [Acididesulfobacillus acetoxydans]CEJ09487.1 Helix-turn-helix [Acididesulfobacillus acetoxydans]
MLKGGTALKAYLSEHNIRQAALAKSCGLSESYLSKILSGQRRSPRFAILLRLAAEIDLPVRRVRELLDSPYDSFISERILLERATKQFFDLLRQVFCDHETPGTCRADSSLSCRHPIVPPLC